MNEIYDDELSEGFLEIADNMKKYGGVELKDDNTDKGGVAFKGETLQDFLDDLADNSIETLDDVNDVLKDNGIQPIEENLDDEVDFEEYMGTTTWDKSRDRKGWETYNGKEDVGEIDAYVEYDDNKQKILVTITKYVSKNEDGTLKSEEKTKEFTDVEEAINWANEKIGKTKIQESLDTNNKIYKMAQELGKLLADKELTLDVSIYILGKRFHIKDDGTLEYDIDANPRDYFDYVRTPNILSMSFEGGLYDVLNYGNSDFLDQFFRKYGLFFELGNAWNGSVYTIDEKDDYEWDKIIYNQDDAITENLDDKDENNKKDIHLKDILKGIDCFVLYDDIDNAHFELNEQLNEDDEDLNWFFKMTDKQLKNLTEDDIKNITNLELLYRIAKVDSSKLSNKQLELLRNDSKKNIIISKEDIEELLKMFRKCDEIYCGYPGKTRQFLKDNNLTLDDCLYVIKNLKVEDYFANRRNSSEGYEGNRIVIFEPKNVTLKNGRKLGDYTLYIKLDIDETTNKSVAMISFHKADHENKLPYKDNDDKKTQNKDGDNKKMGINNSIKNESIDTKKLLKCQQAPREVEKKSREVVDPAYAKASDDINQANDKKEEIVTMEEIPTTEDRFKKPLVNQKGAREMRLTLDESLFEEVDDKEINNKLEICIDVIVENDIKENILSGDIEDKYDEQTLEDWYDFASNIESIIDRNFIVENISLSKKLESLSEYIDFYCKDDEGNKKEGLIDLRLSDHKSTTNARRVRRNRVKRIDPNYKLVSVIVNGKHFDSYDLALDHIKSMLDNLNSSRKNKPLKESKSNILSYHEFVDYLDSINNGYTGFSKVKNDKGVGYRYNLKNKLTREQHSYLEQYDNVFFGETQYKYAPEIKYDTVILLDRMNKIEESKEPRYIAREANGKEYPHRIIHRRIQNPKYKEETVNEDIEKTSKGKWVNKGKEGTHGEFKTKKAAREQQKAMYSKGFKGKKLKEEYGAYKDEPYCEEIADDLESGVWISETYNGTPWELTINEMSQDEFSSWFAEYLAKEVSYPVRDGHLRYMDLDLIINKNSLPNEPDRFIPDLIKLGFDREDIDQWLKSPNEDEEIETWVDYDIDFDEDKWEENNREDVDLPTEVTYDFYTLVDDDVDINSDDYNLDDEIVDRLSDDYGSNFLDFDYKIDKKSGDVYVYNIKWGINENLKRGKKKLKESNNGLTTSTAIGLSDDEIESKKNNLYSKYRNKEKPYNLKQYWEEKDREEMEELDFRNWVNSCMVYDDTEKLTPEELKHSDTLKIYRIDFDRALEIIEEQKERFKKARVNYNVHTDEEGVSYNSVDWDVNESLNETRDVKAQEKMIAFAQNSNKNIKEKLIKEFNSLRGNKDDQDDFEQLLSDNSTKPYWNLDTIVRDDVMNAISTIYKEENLNENYTHFTYKSGGNPYIAKTDKEARRILNKYKGRIRKIKDGFYEIDDTIKDGFITESKGLIRKYRGYNLHDTGDSITITDSHGKTVGTARNEIGAEGIIDELVDKKDIKENIGQDIAEYQKWVDYDMKRYGKISEKTNKKVRDAGLKIVKDIYGDYEVIANEPIREDFFVDRKENVHYTSDGTLISKDDKVYTLTIFPQKGKNGHSVLIENPRDAFDEVYFKEPKDAENFADKNYPNAYSVVIRENDWWDEDIKGFRISGFYKQRLNGEWVMPQKQKNESLNEAKEEDNPIKDIRTNVLEFENGGDYIELYIDYKDGKLIAGMTTNAGIVPEYQIEYDDEKSADENLQNLYDEIVAEHPEYLETIEERNKNS